MYILYIVPLNGLNRLLPRILREGKDLLCSKMKKVHFTSSVVRSPFTAVYFIPIKGLYRTLVFIESFQFLGT